MKFKKVKTLKDLKKDPRVIEYHKDTANTYWINLTEESYNSDAENCIHEDTLKECLDILNNWTICPIATKEIKIMDERELATKKLKS